MADHQDHNELFQDYSQVIAVLTNMFGEIMDTNAIGTIVETCDGDLPQCIELIMKMDENEKSLPVSKNPSTSNLAKVDTHKDRQPQEQSTSLSTQSSTPESTQSSTSQPTLSYAKMSKTTGAIPKKQEQRSPNRARKPQSNLYMLFAQRNQIIKHHDNGYRVLVIMRGPPGCGKSFLAKQLIDETIGPGEINYRSHICSSDDFFYSRGKYIYNRERLDDAHAWNQNRVRDMLQQGLSPIIVDNTNIEDWETENYVRYAVKEGYYIEVVIPDTPWAGNSFQLFKRNSHNVPLPKIKKMLNSFEPSKTGDDLIRLFRISYPSDKIPPVFRVIPAVKQKKKVSVGVMNTPISNPANSDKHLILPSTSTNKVILNQTLNQKNSEDTDINDTEMTSGIPNNYKEIEQQLHEFSVLEQVWENSGYWDEKSPTVNKVASIENSDPKPQRQKQKQETLLPPVTECQDWRNITTFLPSWAEDSIPTKQEEPIPIETESRSTCMEIGDFQNANNKYKIVACRPRDINMFYMPQHEKIPDKRMLDKSTVTNEHLIMESYKCVNEEKHFVAFRKMFKNIAKADLREIFDKCCGDVNWAVEIVLDGVATNQIDTIDDVIDSDTEELEDGQCQCMAAYNVIPDRCTISVPQNSPVIPDNPSQFIQKKLKKDKAISDTAMELKKQFEQNFVINENHYSQHCLKIKKIRAGQFDTDVVTPGTSTSDTKLTPDGNNPSTSTQHDISDAESDNSDEIEATMNFNLGEDVIRQLDCLFGRKEMPYPSNIVPLVNMPVSILNTINALWMESLSHQLEAQADYSRILMKQDEEFACEIALKEAEVIAETEAGEEPKIPDFKMIMDMELAISMYQKNVAEWRNNEQNDLATKMTKTKLYNLFPDISQDVLSELLMAHDNNFQATVEGLLVSTGQANVLETKNGINKFVMEKEKARQQTLMEEEKKKVLEEGDMWHMLEDGSNISMEMVNKHRVWAQELLKKRNRFLESARSFLQSGMWEYAEYYSDMATFFTKQYEKANSIAAQCLVQLNSTNIADTTLDLHLLYVKEAMETLDLFLDHHIQLMRSNPNSQAKYPILHVITGRGLHSRGGPKIKPAARQRLKQRGFEVHNMNPGLVYFQLDKSHKMTFELPK